MLAEFIDRFEKLAHETRRVQVVHKGARSMLLSDGVETFTEQLDPPLRCNTVLGLEDIIAVCRDTAMAPKPEVHHGGHKIVVLLDRDDRRECVCMPLYQSERFGTLTAMARPQSLDIRAAVRLLKFDLHGTNTSSVLDAIRRIDFKRSSSGTNSIEHGKESLGRAVEAAVQQADRVPESFAVEVPVYTNAGLRGFVVRVEVGVYIDLANERVEFRTLPDEIQRSIDSAQAFIRQQLVEALPSVPIFNGQPGSPDEPDDG